MRDRLSWHNTCLSFLVEEAIQTPARSLLSKENRMSVSGISSGNLFSYENQSQQNNIQQFKQEFEQLGEDLKSGNLSAAQSDFATLQQIGSQASSTSLTQGGNAIAQAVQQLGQDLQSGNLSAAQQDYTTLKQNLTDRAGSMSSHHHHGHGGGGIGKLLAQLGQALQSGDLTSAKSIFSSLQTDLQNYGQSSTQSSAPVSGTAINNVSVTA